MDGILIGSTTLNLNESDNEELCNISKISRTGTSPSDVEVTALMYRININNNKAYQLTSPS